MERLTGKKHPSGFAIQGYICAQFLAEAIKKSGSTRSKEVVKALEGLTIDTPIGKQTMGNERHERRRWFWDLTRSDPRYLLKILDPIEYVPFEDSIWVDEKAYTYREDKSDDSVHFGLLSL